MKQKFQPGEPVFIKNNLIGIVFSCYLWTCQDAKEFLYRIVVDAKDCAYRIHHNNIDQTSEKHLFIEDLDNLRFHTDQVVIIEVFEHDLFEFVAESCETTNSEKK